MHSEAVPVTRIHELDALRGFAVCGITLVNTWQHTMGELAGRPPAPADWVFENLLQSRFYPIFSFLFGVSFVLFLRSAARRTPRPWWPLPRRLAVLACLGLLHRLASPGEVLLPYAITGAVVLLPASFLPRWLVLAAGIAATAWGTFIQFGGIWIIPGLFLLGMAMIEYAPGPRALLPTLAVSAPLAVALTWGWNYLWTHPETFEFPYTPAVYPLAGLAAATAYCAGVLLLVRARPAPAAFLRPLGRITLTAYLFGSLCSVVAAPLLARDPTRLAVIGFGAALVAVPAAFAHWWLARFRYGPLEWAWRCLTWWEVVPNRRPSPAPRPFPDHAAGDLGN
ncbi:membrane protein [Sphaerisporangium siamense]|uniref:Putative membrane protein YeiB n=1 Tax=Sphaerisporangium siamense TaxID=795645 RepID=A0A7W7DA53_9ACTN|nr:DUF418 domain-containing protein [Sphaerisporangium siamense]MBB4702856.1 putative membrane protein YeiB [Sphaerisporangium siamense]GII83387.1 membrane protein [Sphaerisporangium siamense]